MYGYQIIPDSSGTDDDGAIARICDPDGREVGWVRLDVVAPVGTPKLQITASGNFTFEGVAVASDGLRVVIDDDGHAG